MIQTVSIVVSTSSDSSTRHAIGAARDGDRAKRHVSQFEREQPTGRHFADLKPLRSQLWLWFAGMMIMTLPWHYTGLQGQWRRVAAFDYSDPMIAAWGPWVIVSLVGGVMLAISALMFVYNLVLAHRRGPAAAGGAFHYAKAVHPPERVPSSLNGFGLWNILVAVLMAAAYGYPIAQFFIDPPPQAVIHRLN